MHPVNFLVKIFAFVFSVKAALSFSTHLKQPYDELHLNLLVVYEDIKLWREIFILGGSTITFIGFVLNTFCIIIFYKSKLFRNSSFPYYVYIISIVDTLNIFIRFLIPQSIENYVRSILVKKFFVDPNEVNTEKYDTFTTSIASDYHCSLFLYFYNSLTLISVWLMAAVSLERWLVMKFALQTKYMIKLRALLILLFIFVTVFVLNIFDLAPGLYIKPQWYANLTLLCERDDTLGYENNSIRIQKQIGSFSFNSETFAFIRILLQTLVPFIFVLFFNSLIIYSFKKIKLAVAGKNKSTSCVSVISGISSMGNSGSIKYKSQLHTKERKRDSHKSLKNQDNNYLQPTRYVFKGREEILSSRSPSPLQSISVPNTPVTPTSIVATLSLAENKTQTRDSSPNDEFSNKIYDNSSLMPPEARQTSESGTSSLGASNSSANLSVATNLTASTNLKFPSTNVVELELGKSGTSIKIKRERRSSKAKLSRETDIMLIVLSFSILLSQLPCTIAWYLIYYCNVLPEITSVYISARTPIILFIIRLLEMVYFSLNFFFYITLSPSLRKEILNYTSRKSLRKLYKNIFFQNRYMSCFEDSKKRLSGDSKLNSTKIHEGNSKFNSDCELETQRFESDVNKNNKNNKNKKSLELAEKLDVKSPLKRPNSLKKNEVDCFNRESKQSFKFLARKNRKESCTSTSIKIVIDDLSDEHEKLNANNLENECGQSCLTDLGLNKFNCSSPSFFACLNSNQKNSFSLKEIKDVDSKGKEMP